MFRKQIKPSKMKKQVIFLSFIFLLSCAKDLEIKQLKIDFRLSGTSTGGSSATGRIIDELQYFDFNINNYENCISVTLVGYISASDPGTCYLDLYNLTDSVPIANSTISTTSLSNVWVESQNFLHEFPDKDIDLTLRIRSENDGEFVHLSSASLYINFY
jgi:hypothetical protein